MALCVLFWVWALVFPLAYYLAFVYFLYVYDGKDKFKLWKNAYVTFKTLFFSEDDYQSSNFASRCI
jgi:hypothetical protein